MSLWRKSWLECRPRVLLTAVLWVVTSAGTLGLFGLPKISRDPIPFWNVYILTLAGVVAPLVAMILAGSGINSQTASGVLRGTHPSTHFMLSLPVSRRRSLWVRAALGGLLLLVFVLLSVCVVGFLAPIRGAEIPSGRIISAIPVVLLSSYSFFGLGTLLYTWLDELWGGTIGMAAVGFLCGGFVSVSEEVGVHIPVGLADLPWPVIVVYVAVGLISLGGANIVVERKEY